MPQELIISISGLRGIVGENLNASIAAEYAAAFGTFLKRQNQRNEKLVVALGRDSRPSGEMLESAVAAGLASVGVDVVKLGIVPTPSVGIMTVKLGCAGGVVITASHNPIEYNGIKLLLDNGIAPPKDKSAEIKNIYLQKQFDYVASIDCGRMRCDDTADEVHIEKVLSIIDRQKIADRKIKVVLDSVNGAGGRPAKELLEQLGCSVVPINTEPTGIFAHTPEPIRENLGQLCDEVKKHAADIGFAQDPDADRLAIVDENGNYIGEEYTLALSAMQVLVSQKSDIAANLSTSRMVDDIAAEKGVKVIRTPVGEANVAEAMIEAGCVIGGEGNGGVIDMRIGPVRDSLVSIGLVLQLITDEDKTLGQLVGQIPAYYMHKEKFAADSAQAEKIIAAAKAEFADAKVNQSDGCRFDFADGWVHLRCSNTEPVMRMIAEFATSQAAEQYIGKVKKILGTIVG